MVYFLHLLADVSIVKIEREVRMGYRLLVENSDEIQFDIDYREDTIIRNVPFYVGIFNEYGNIEEFIETSTQLAFNDLIKQMDIQVGKKSFAEVLLKNIGTSLTNKSLISDNIADLFLYSNAHKFSNNFSLSI